MIPVLGLDYGKKFTGVAYAITPLAEPCTTIPTSSVLSQLPPLISQHQLSAIVVGISEAQMAIDTKKFCNTLAQTLNLPVYTQDETLSSYITRKKVAQSGLKKSRRQQKIDHLVAAMILQDFIDTYFPLDELPPVDTMYKTYV